MSTQKARVIVDGLSLIVGCFTLFPSDTKLGYQM